MIHVILRQFCLIHHHHHHHHHYQIFDWLAGTGATSTTVGPLPGGWLAARMADLSPDLQVCLSWGSIAESFHSLQFLSASCFLDILGLAVLNKKDVLWYSLEVPQWGTSNEYPKRMFLWRNKNYPRITVDSLFWSPKTHWNTSRYPYLDISDLQNWGKQWIEQPHLTNEYVIWLLKLRDIMKILWKRGEIAPKEQFLLFSTIFCYLLLDLTVKTGTRFSLRGKRLFEIMRSW